MEGGTQSPSYLLSLGSITPFKSLLEVHRDLYLCDTLFDDLG